MTDLQRLQQLLRGEHPCIVIQTMEEDAAVELITSACVEGGLVMMLWSMSHGLREGLMTDVPAIPDTDHPVAALYRLAEMNRPVIAAMLDLCGHLKDERTMRMFRDAVRALGKVGGHLILVDSAADVPPVVKSLATFFEISLPDDEELDKLLRETLRARNEICRIQVNLNKSDLQTIVRNLRGLSLRQAKQVIVDSVCDDQRFDMHDINRILAGKREHMKGFGLLEYVEAPVSIDEIGGLRRLKYWLEQRREALGDEAVEFGLAPPRGVLMLGVQGAGKSLSAKAVATAWQRPLLRLDAGALYDKYIGESERRLRDALHQAEMMSPIVLWIDEIEKAFASAAAQSADGGLSKRMFGTLLTWMQEHTEPVFLIATANDIEALPPELLRKGRFDEIFFVDLPDEEARRAIFQIHLKKRKRDPKKFDLDALAKSSEGFSGAEIEQAIISGMHNAFAVRDQFTSNHILDALRNSPPLSVTMAEKVEALREWSKGRCVPAD